MDNLAERLMARWKLIVVIAWLLYAGVFLYFKWNAIHGFSLGDTDDNLRLVQVRDWLHGQAWYDLRQHHLDPLHGGANIHWSRLVDLPLAGLMLAIRPFAGGLEAERWAAAIAPLLPILPILFGLALVARRLVGPGAGLLALAGLVFAGSAIGMVQPLRIDHHGWQLAFLALSLAGLADPKRARGGATVGIASALSLAIGLEMIIYLVLMGAAQVLFWVADRDQRRRLATYAVTVGGGTALSFLAFASYANRLPVCDALSPVWLTDALLGGAAMLGLAWLSPGKWQVRLALAAASGAVLFGVHAFAFPHCLSRLEGISPEASQLWMSHVREARPIYRHGFDIAALTLALPLTGLVGWAWLAWRARGDAGLLARTLAVWAVAFTALALLLWQTRTGPAAQMMAIPGAVAIVALLAPRARASRNLIVRTVGTAAIVVIGLGGAVPLLSGYFPKEKQTAAGRRIAVANNRCPSLAGLHAVALQPAGTIFTYVDFGPRIIAVTHHRAIAGPYHRNFQAIVDIMNAFRGSPEQAHAIVAGKYHSDYLMICPDQSTATIFMAEAPKGFYAQLAKGQVPAWLQPVDLGKKAPWTMWRVVG